MATGLLAFLNLSPVALISDQTSPWNLKLR
jgi:hypothetical protein